MQLKYSEYDYEHDANFSTVMRLPYCLSHTRMLNEDDPCFFSDVNEWIISYFGEIGEYWGWNRKLIHSSNSGPDHLIYFFSNRPSTIRYIWHFKRKEDASLFKLRWGGDV